MCIYLTCYIQLVPHRDHFVCCLSVSLSVRLSCWALVCGVDLRFAATLLLRQTTLHHLFFYPIAPQCILNIWLPVFCLRYHPSWNLFNQYHFLWLIAPPAPQPPGVMNNGSRDVTKDIQKLQQQLQDIKDQVNVYCKLWSLSIDKVNVDCTG